MLLKLIQKFAGNGGSKECPIDFREKNISQETCDKIKRKLQCRPDMVNVLQPLSKTRFVVFDTETTGFDPCNGDKVISIGAIVLQHGEINRFQFFDRLVNPFRPIPEEVSELTGITDEMVAGADNFYNVFSDFIDFIGDGILVAHNADFDIRFINWRLRSCQAKLQCPVVDTLKISYSLHPRLKNHTLDNLLWIYKIPSARRHTAIGDAILTAELLQKFLVELRKSHVTTVLDLFNHLHWQFYR